MLSGIATSPKLILKGSHQTLNQSIVCSVMELGRVRTMFLFLYASRGLVLAVQQTKNEKRMHFW